MLPKCEPSPAVAGDDGAQHDWRSVHAGLCRYLRARAVRCEVAEDVAQETIARLVTLSRRQPIGSVFALAFRIADNLVIDHHRAEGRNAEQADESLSCTAPSLDRVVDSQRAVEVLQRCLRKMPALRRDVLVRRRMHQQSCRAIAEDLSLSQKAVEKHITRGLVDLRRAMEKAGVDLAGWD